MVRSSADLISCENFPFFRHSLAFTWASLCFLVVMFGLFFEVADNYYKKVTIVLAFGLLSAVVTVSTISAWHRYKDILILNRDA